MTTSYLTYERRKANETYRTLLFTGSQVYLLTLRINLLKQRYLRWDGGQFSRRINVYWAVVQDAPPRKDMKQLGSEQLRRQDVVPYRFLPNSSRLSFPLHQGLIAHTLSRTIIFEGITPRLLKLILFFNHGVRCQLRTPALLSRYDLLEEITRMLTCQQRYPEKSFAYNVTVLLVSAVGSRARVSIMDQASRYL